jgi:xylulokinase
MSAPRPSTVLAVDLGTGGPKAAVVTTAGAVLGAGFEPVGLIVTPGGGVEQRPAEWWAAVVASARRALAAAADGGPAPAIDAVAVTGQWAGTVALGSDGEPLCDALTWMDARGAAAARAVAAAGPVRIAGYGPLRLARWIRLTAGAPSLSGRDPFGHILYLKAERPDIYAATATFLEPVNWLNLKLTGRAASSADTATLHWLTDTRDLGSVRYDDRLLRLAGIDRAKLPELLPSACVVGTLQPGPAAELGIAPGARVVSATGDTMSAAVGSGAVADYAGHLYVGTSSWIQCHVPFKRTDVRRAIATLPAALPGRYLVSCEQQTAGASLERLREEWLAGTPEAAEGYPALDALAASAPPGSGRVIFTPWLNGERTPVEDHLVRGGFHNLSLDTTRAQLVRAVLEGVALNTRWMLDGVERFVRRPLPELRFIGGGALSDLWCQIFADVLDRRILRVVDPVNANIRGAAFLAGVALGELHPADIPARAPVDAAFDPDPARRATYDELSHELRALYKRTRGIYARLNAPRGVPSADPGATP